ncbi:hypothetical protein ACJIZ3_005152 [Penstemon smallii]|uniref:Uncharacterized protein n=1 Tax=Penstemon smallii TaxID=265156 RepID=A0ABD3S4A4_9LAMI
MMIAVPYALMNLKSHADQIADTGFVANAFYDYGNFGQCLANASAHFAVAV